MEDKWSGENVIDTKPSVPSVPSVAHLVAEYDNLVVLRTFSKWAGLAGLRVGYGIMHESIAAHLWKIKQPYNISVAGLLAAEASLHDVAYLRGNVARIVAERARLFAALREIPFLQPYPSHANFILCGVNGGQEPRTKNQEPSRDRRPGTGDRRPDINAETQSGRDAEYNVSGSSQLSTLNSQFSQAFAIKQNLERQGILIRYYKTALLRDCIRISVGTPEQNDAVVAALRAMNL
jgi:histidinol-phosphate aminotransferase